MMTIRIKPDFLIPACYGPRIHHNKTPTPSSWTITMTTNSQDIKKQELSLQLQNNSAGQPQIISQTRFQFDRLFVRNRKIEFAQFVAREAVHDEEYWVITVADFVDKRLLLFNGLKFALMAFGSPILELVLTFSGCTILTSISVTTEKIDKINMNHWITLGKSHIGRSLERFLVHKTVHASSITNEFWAHIDVDQMKGREFLQPIGVKQTILVTAAWLRAETHLENRRDDRFADSYRKKFTEQEFNALKRQSETKLGQKSACIVTVKKEHDTVSNSVVGTLDVSIRPFLHGETFPGEKVKAPIFHSTERKDPKNQYGYIANLCVARPARRQGIARHMLHFAIESVVSEGAEQVYVHVHRSNIAAQELYQKLGFKVVDLATPQLSRDKMYLLCYTP